VKLFTQDTKVQALRRAPLFEDLSRKELVQLARASEDLEVAPGKCCVTRATWDTRFFVIVDGKVEVTRNGQRVAARGGGEFVGEIALLEETPRTATVTAKTPVRLFVLTRKDFRHLVNENPSVERKVLRALARRVVELSGDPTLA
jgi:CRP/FNR family cyclic AMP-dependent transcriptional regulator